MTSLVRTPPAPARLVARILESPELVAAVRELPAAALGRLVDRVGLEDAGELVALASREQLLGVLDRDLWRAPAPGEDERFEPARFALWLEILLEGGEAALVERLCALPGELLALAVHRLVLVVDTDALWQGLAEPSPELERLEHALDAPLFEEWQEFRLLARDPTHWDVVWTALLALDRDHHELLRAILERCCALAAEQVEEQGGLYRVLTSEAMLEGDAAGEREDRRAAEGFVAPADARSFLALARGGADLETRDPITTAYFRALAGRPAPAPAAAADASRLVRLLEDAGVVEPTGGGPLAALGAGAAAEPARAEREGAAAPAPPELLRAALSELRGRGPGLFSQRMEELGYLANVLIAGRRDRRPRPVEALEEAIAVCEAGLERALDRDGTLDRAVELLRTTPADQLFRRGYRDGRR